MPGEGRGQGSKGGQGGKKGKGKGKGKGKENKLALAGSSGKDKVTPEAAAMRAFLLQPRPRVPGGVGSAGTGTVGAGGQQPRVERAAAAVLEEAPPPKKIKVEPGGSGAGKGKGKEAEGVQGISQLLLSDVFKRQPQSDRTPAHPQQHGGEELGGRGLEATAARNLGLGNVESSLLLPRSCARAERSCFARCLPAVALHPATLRALLCASVCVAAC